MSIRIAVLLSGKHGRGSNMQAIARGCADGRIDGEIVSVIGNFADSPALAAACALGIPVGALASPGRRCSEQEETAYDEALLTSLGDVAPDLICLAGYLHKLPSSIVRQWSGRIMNTHPGLLPAFGGKRMFGIHVHQAVLDYGAKVSGCTVHFVDETYDTGPIILQKTVPVLDNDTAESLAARVLIAEHQAYPEAVALYSHDRLQVVGRRVTVLGDLFRTDM